MLLKPPAAAGIALKAGRGLFQQAAYDLRPDRFVHVAVIVGGVDLVPGQETAVATATTLPPNANVSRVVASLAVSPSEHVPEDHPTTVSVTRGTGAPDTFEVSAQPSPGPSNVSVRLEGGEAFWTQTGPLESGSHDLPDFAQDVNAYLDRLDATAGVALQFLVRSDTPGRARITIGDIDYTRVQTQAWPNPLDDTIRVDRNLAADFGAIDVLTLDALAVAAGEAPRLQGVRLDVVGEVGPERLYGTAQPWDGHELATVGGDYSVAHGLAVDAPLKLVGLAGLLIVEDQTELYLELRADAAGAPATGDPLARATLKIEPADEVTRWQYAPFESAVDVQPGARYWAVVKGVRGRARIALQAGAALPATPLGVASGPTLVNRGGALWRSVGRATALVGPVHLPGIDNQSAAVEVGLAGTDAFTRVDPGPGGRTLSLDGATAHLPAALIVRSYARGAISVANVVQEYGA